MTVFDPKTALFKRKFALVPYKNLKLSLAEVSLCKDFVTDTMGDPYPRLAASADACERVAGNRYHLTKGEVTRHFAQFFPYATYEMTMTGEGEAGFRFHIPGADACVYLSEKTVILQTEGLQNECPFPASDERALIVTCRPSAFDIYTKENGRARFVTSFDIPAFADSAKESVFTAGYAAFLAKGDVTLLSVTSYIDSGISVADLRPIRFENGDVMTEGGKIFLTASLRMEKEAVQGILSWVPGTADFTLTGVLFYSSGDGVFANDVAASLLYHREEKRWLLWVCSFLHDHVLGYASFAGDVRWGVNVLDITLAEGKNGDFLSLRGDEDPDFFYDEKEGRWLFAVCRLDDETKEYRYHFYASSDPFRGYTPIGKGTAGAETGGSFVKIEGETHFLCGNDFTKRADYRIYTRDGMDTAHFDYPDGGFRGWGTLIPLSLGTRTRYFWLTFDRHNGSDFRWSYGNLYCFEA